MFPSHGAFFHKYGAVVVLDNAVETVVNEEGRDSQAREDADRNSLGRRPCWQRATTC